MIPSILVLMQKMFLVTQDLVITGIDMAAMMGREGILKSDLDEQKEEYDNASHVSITEG